MTTRSEKVRLVVEVTSALAVVATLGLVVWELRAATEQARLNTRAVEVAAYQDLISQISEVNRINIENPEFASLRSRARAGIPVTDSEAGQLRAYWYLLFRHGDMAYYQYERGVLSLDRLTAVLGPLEAELDDPTFTELWAERRASFAPEYAAFIDSLSNAR